MDLVIERVDDALLVEVEDLSISKCPYDQQQDYFQRLSDNSILKQELTPQARDSYTFFHLMERDDTPFKVVVIIGLDAFDSEKQRALRAGFKDRLFSDIKCETDTPWRRLHIADCVVLSAENGNQTFNDCPFARVAVGIADGEQAA